MKRETKCERKRAPLPDKVFTERNSLITELMEVKHFKTIRHIFVALLFGFVCNDVISALLNIGEFSFGLRMIQIGFGKFHLVVLLWSFMFGISMLIHVFFQVWANRRSEFSPTSLSIKLWDALWLNLLVSYYIGSLYFTPVVMVRLNLPIVSSTIIISEQIRFLMKAHAFVRSNAPKVLNYKPHNDNSLELPKISTYVYFSFAPTLVYRDKYPRTKAINWKYAILSFMDVLVIIWLESFIFEKCFVKKFEHTGKSKINWNSMLLMIFENSLPGVLILVFNFYLLLHSWLNGFAEILRFADRKFYEDWWTSTDFSRYFRTWNIVVHDWLFTYIYKDLYELSPKHKLFPKMMVFLISALVHEYIICFMLRLFFPVLFMNFFTFGLILTFIRTKHPIFNVLFLYGMALGVSIQLSLYTMEYFARNNCPIGDYNLTSHLTPRIITSDCIYNL